MNKQIKIKKPQCPLCNETEKAVLKEVVNEFNIFYCRGCELEFADPMKNPGENWYETEYKFSSWEGREYLLLGWRHYKFLEDPPFRGGMLLDIGCSNGDFLLAARDKGYEVYGIDFDRKAIELGRKKFNLKNLFCGTIEDFRNSNPDKKFDVITFFEVLEHLDRPLQFIESTKKILKPDGYIAFSVPNRERWIKDSVWFDYPPHHLTRWSRKSIRKLLEKTSFEVVKLRTDSEAGFEYFLQNKIKFGIVKRMFKRLDTKDEKAENSDKKEQTFRKADRLLRMKFLIFKIIAQPINLILKLMDTNGVDIYVLARNKIL